jgi:Holliday junction resolvase RusA-like endonuclease
MPDMALNFFIFGEPEAQPRPRWGMGRFYSPKTAFWKSAFMAAKANRSRPAFDHEPIALSITLFFTRPKSTPKWVAWKISKPDADNVAKAVMDAMTAAGWWNDDAIVAHLIVYKVYADAPQDPGARVIVTPIGGNREK